jgi:uncharacterized protein
LPGRWIAEEEWPPRKSTYRRCVLTDDGLRPEGACATPRTVCSLQTVGKDAGAWCPFGGAPDQAGDQREDDAYSLVFDTTSLDASIEMLGAPIVTLDIASDEPIANLTVRLCDVHPSGASLRISYGVLNLTHRDGHETPTPLVAGCRYQVRMQLNDAGAVFPVGHRVRLALSTNYWPMIWPSPEKATLTIFGGSLELPVRLPHTIDAVPSLPEPETAPPERPTVLRRGVVYIDRIGLELGSKATSRFHVKDDDPLSAVVELSRTETISRGAWQVRIETATRLSCTPDAFLLRATLRAREGGDEIFHREWNHSVPRDLM